MMIIKSNLRFIIFASERNLQLFLKNFRKWTVIKLHQLKKGTIIDPFLPTVNQVNGYLYRRHSPNCDTASGPMLMIDPTHLWQVRVRLESSSHTWQLQNTEREISH